MKTDCIHYNNCRKPVQQCKGKCKDYKKENKPGDYDE